MSTAEAIPARALCRAIELPYATFKRWKARRSRGEPLARRPGPKKVKPFDLGALEAEIREMAHRRRRTDGTGDLYLRWSEAISRRELHALVAEARKEANRRRRDEMQHVEWLVPRLIWAIDDTECGRDPKGQKLVLTAVRDLGSKHELRPKAGEGVPDGETVAVHLDRLFTKHTPPLFLKLDNHGNYNNPHVDRVLEKYFVIPMNSPCYYPQYNGGRERGHRELKETIRQEIESDATLTVAELQARAASAACDLNTTERPCLGGVMPCVAFNLARDRGRSYNRRRRKEIYDEIERLAARILSEMDDDGPKAVSAAHRVAVMNWLQREGIISVSAKGKVSTGFPA